MSFPSHPALVGLALLSALCRGEGKILRFSGPGSSLLSNSFSLGLLLRRVGAPRTLFSQYVLQPCVWAQFSSLCSVWTLWSHEWHTAAPRPFLGPSGLFAPAVAFLWVCPHPVASEPGTTGAAFSPEVLVAVVSPTCDSEALRQSVVFSFLEGQVPRERDKYS